MVKPLVIIGVGGHGREAYDIVSAMNADSREWEMLGFLDDGREPGSLAEPLDVPVLGGTNWLDSNDAWVVVGIDSPVVREAIVNRLRPSVRYASLRHPSATTGSVVSLGAGSILAAGARVTHNVAIGRHTHLNVGATVSHDCTIGAFVTISPGSHISGLVTVEDRCWIGIGASLIQHAVVGADAIIGAGAVVTRPLAGGQTYVGVPARPIRQRVGLG